MAKHKKMVLLSLVVGLGSLSSGLHSDAESGQMSILPIFDESGNVVSTPTGRLDLVREFRPAWHLKVDTQSLPESEEQKFEAEKVKLDRQRKMVKRRFREKETQLDTQEMQAKVDTLKEKIQALNQAATTKKVQEILEDENLNLHDKLQALERLARLINREFDKLAYVKEPGRFSPAEISDQEDVALAAALRSYEKRRGGHYRQGNGHHRKHMAKKSEGCTSGMCSMK